MFVKMHRVEQLNQRVDIDYIKASNIFSRFTHSPADAVYTSISLYITQAILLEVCTHPKPGLVTRISNGSHRDMSIFTFMMSSALLSQVFMEFETMGGEFYGNENELFNVMRSYGLVAERKLLQITKGVNTQRGILFAGGVLCTAFGYACKEDLNIEKIIVTVKKMAAGLVQRELQTMNYRDMTAGKELYKAYGITGIRGEVEKGFPSVLNVGLPALEEAFSKGCSLNDAFLHTLINLMTVVEDSNIIWRSNIQTLKEVQARSREILNKGSVLSNMGKLAISEAEKTFVNKGISPGGSADLLSITIALYLLKYKEFNINII